MTLPRRVLAARRRCWVCVDCWKEGYDFVYGDAAVPKPRFTWCDGIHNYQQGEFPGELVARWVLPGGINGHTHTLLRDWRAWLRLVEPRIVGVLR